MCSWWLCTSECPLSSTYCRVLKASLVPVETKVTKETKERRDTKGRLDSMVVLELLEQQAPREIRDLKESRDHR